MAALAALLALTEGLFFLAPRNRGAFTFDVGPSTGAYLSGFHESEERLPVTFRWSAPYAQLTVPIESARDSGTLELRYARFVDTPTPVRLFVNGRAAGSFRARPGRFRTESFPVELTEAPLELEIIASEPGPDDLGLAIDWVRVTGARFRLPPSFIYPRLLVAGVFLLALASGLGWGVALCAGAALALVEGGWAALDPFGLAHVTSRVVVPALGLSMVVALALKRGARPVLLMFLTSYLLKGAGVFYPSYFYPDVRNHRRYVFAFAEAEGSLTESGLAAQIQVRTAYPRTIAGRTYAMPYSPLYFVPFSWLPRDPHFVEDAMKHVSVACAALEVVVVFFLARALFGEGAGVAAALLSAFLPPLYSRLLLAMYPTIAGHLLDLLAILTAAQLARDPDGVKRLAALFGAVLASFLTYIAGLFNLTAFSLSLALFERRRALSFVALWAGAATATVGLLYFSFARTFLNEIAPALLQGKGGGSNGSLWEGLAVALARIPLFYGWGYPALALAGFILARRTLTAAAFNVLAAYGVAFAILLALRSLPGGIFKDLKETTFVGPLVAVCAGASLEAIAARGRSGKLAAALIAVGLIGFGLAKYRDYLTATTGLAGLS